MQPVYSDAIGKTCWAIPEGYIPPSSMNDANRALLSHEAACILNANDEDAHITITLYFVDRDPAGPFSLTVPARRTLHMRFNELSEPEKIPLGVDYASVFTSDVPIVVQHTRLDSRHAEIALLSTMAYAN